MRKFVSYFLLGMGIIIIPVACKLYKTNDETYLTCKINNVSYEAQPTGGPYYFQPAARLTSRNYSTIIQVKKLTGKRTSETYSMEIRLWENSNLQPHQRYFFKEISPDTLVTSLILENKEGIIYHSFNHSGWIEITEMGEKNNGLAYMVGKFEVEVRNINDSTDVKSIKEGKFKAITE